MNAAERNMLRQRIDAEKRLRINQARGLGLIPPACSGCGGPSEGYTPGCRTCGGRVRSQRRRDRAKTA